MRFIFCVIATLLLIVGCDYFDDSDDMSDSDDMLNLVINSTPVALPVDAAWELIATLQHNPLEPRRFYISPEQNEAIINAYLAGKHFIFEIGGEFIDELSIRNYIIQPHRPFQDKYKNSVVVLIDNQRGVKIDSHTYFFRSEGWFDSAENRKYAPPSALEGEGKPIGLGVEFSVHRHSDGGVYYGCSIGLLHESMTIARGSYFITEAIRLRIYVSR